MLPMHIKVFFSSEFCFHLYIFIGSRKRFSQKEAEKWWEENQTKVYHKYEIEEI
jgi:hypothetical protein